MSGIIFTSVIALWTLTSVILHFCGVGAFASWAVIASPFSWSCFFFAEWLAILIIVCLIVAIVTWIIAVKS